MIGAKGGIDMGHNTHTRQRGAVSLFVVIFTALLFVAVTVGFTILMLNDQQESTDNDLAQSALDSAYAGTEDAKRVLAQYADCQERALTTSTCTHIRTAIERNQCNTINASLGASSDTSERKVQQTEGDASSALQQAYTCVKITPNTETYVGKTRSEGDIRLIPLKTDGAAFDTVQISWLKREDMDLGTNEPELAPLDDYADLSAAEEANYLRLPTKEQWRQEHRGAILRVGSLQYKRGEVKLDEMDDTARAAFLYASDAGLGDTAATAIDLANADMHRPLTSANQNDLEGKVANYPVEVHCDDTVTEGYLCKTFIHLPQAGDASLFRYLTLASVYRDTSFEIRLLNGSTPVEFKNVQPEIDVTGRANDVLRRVVSRVESADASEAPYPRAAVGSGSDLCKNFVVTDDPDDFRDDGPSSCPDITRP